MGLRSFRCESAPPFPAHGSHGAFRCPLAFPRSFSHSDPSARILFLTFFNGRQNCRQLQVRADPRLCQCRSGQASSLPATRPQGAAIISLRPQSEGAGSLTAPRRRCFSTTNEVTVMNKDQQVSKWRNEACEDNPAGPLYSHGIYAEADIVSEVS